jgi:hypothetical protein
MTGTGDLRQVIIGLLEFAIAEERMLLAVSDPGEAGGPQHWAALPVIAHNTEFRHQQVQRLQAIRAGAAIPQFAEVDHLRPETYQAYAAQPASRVASDCARVAADLLDAAAATGADDLLDPSRHPSLNGRQLWLQIIVRGFWHPAGHLGDYYLGHGQAGRAVALAAHGVATARYVQAPDPVCGMACYSLACVQARAAQADRAIETLSAAISLNPELRANARRDPDLAELRAGGRLAAMLQESRIS